MRKVLHILLLAVVLCMLNTIVMMATDSTYHASTLIATFALFLAISSAVILNLDKNENS